MTTSQHLRTIATLWPDLRDALGAPPTATWPPSGLRAYLTSLDEHDADEAALLRADERSPEQIGTTAAPLRIRILDTMREVETALVELADQIAAEIQRSPMPRAPRQWPASDRVRRDHLAAADAVNPQRWRYTGQRTAPYAALWLCARVEGRPGPCRPLDEAQHHRISRVAADAAERVERALDIAARCVPLAAPCPTCASPIEVHGGAGAHPLARCSGCGLVWSAADAHAA
ncbi:hypothetical protein OG897_06300 [Streptomyces sp. NBC_00237]|uniref:hypothetical protein n=1 Tax=Streptomyces sp. NBC_00237 TaxID=2975687 RepID=UPI00224D977D|nr:hypothetical protein [Streptomyces sp. NBC_00237]MCX5201073.1 hypothetical protein [Streptomyces sp. NBC_00237]